jgi:2-deoxystreptamine N-acetyl-D-glucosaminyltransferase/2-deoxystreptamine glucosyltransferase
MQNHTAALTRALDDRGLTQTVITARLGGAAGARRFGRQATVVRVGLPVPWLRQGWAVGAALAALRHRPVDVVHAHQGEDLAVLPVAAAVARRVGCPLVVTLHVSLRHSVPRLGRRLTALHAVGGAIEQRVLSSAHTVIALTRTTAGRLSGPHRTVVIPSGVEPALFESPARSPLLASIPRPIVLYVGRLAQQKDVPTLVRAFGQVRTPASLVIVGDGPERAHVDGAIEALPAGVRARVHRFGFQPHGQVPGLLAAADLVALPSVYEEMGTVLVEALKAGVPVVASRVGGIPDVVRDGDTGVLVAPGLPDRWAEALDGLLADPDRRARMREACRREAEHYSWDGLADRVLGVYRDALAVRPTSPAGRPATRSVR